MMGQRQRSNDCQEYVNTSSGIFMVTLKTPTNHHDQSVQVYPDTRSISVQVDLLTRSDVEKSSAPTENPSLAPEDKSSSSAPKDKPSSAPKDKPSSSAPKDKPSPSAPKDKPSSSAPKDKPSSSAPKDKPSSSAPKDKPSSSAPKDKPSSSAPKDKPLSSSAPKDKPASATPKGCSSVENQSTLAPKDRPSHSTPKDKTSPSGPKENSSSATPKVNPKGKGQSVAPAPPSSVAGPSKTLQSHKKSTLKRREFPCNTCGRPFTLMSESTRCGYSHMNWSDLQQTKVYHKRCYFCKKIFIIKYRYEIHLLTHFGEKPEKCHRCKKRTTTQGALLNHTRHRHSSVTRFRCNECHRMFHYRYRLRQHERVHLDKETKKKMIQTSGYQCQVCFHKFRCNYNLRRHKLRFHAPV